MRAVLSAAPLLLLATVVIGYWLQAAGVETPRFAQRVGLGSLLWPIAIPAFGAMIAALIAIKNRNPIGKCWRSESVSKADMRAALGILFGPLLALLLQSYVGLEHFGLATKERMLTGFAIGDFLFFAAIGNYAATLPHRAPGGFRTPWTMRDPKIWARIHRYVGRGLILISLSALASLFLLEPKIAIFAHVGAIIVFKAVLFAYSYVLWRSGERVRQTG